MSDPGVVIVDNVLFYEGNFTIKALNTGDIVSVTGYHADSVFVKSDGEKGYLLKGVLVNLHRDIAEEKIFVFARGYFDQGEFLNAARLFHVFKYYFPDSPYLPEALYYLGLSYEEFAKLYSGPDTVSFFLYNKNYQQWYYTGEVYAEIVEHYPDSPFATKASYRLLNTIRLNNIPWGGSVAPIQEELELWGKFADECQGSTEYVLALLEMGYLNRVLYEITEDSDFRKDAVDIFHQVIDDYPNTVYAAQSRINLREIAEGEPIYKY